ncbi:hypothetical protein ACJRO7_006361 [Eucalyptus globulus]|uniref:PGG domain-containing protein n=1 Tax=Eucalyptus globulus TaxID=34317 RepID=A0ABD3IL56_EUCGL
MDVKLSVGDQDEIWERRRQKLEALTGADPSQRQDDPAQPDKFIDPLLFSAAKEPDVDKFIKALEDHCAKERVSLHVLLERRSFSESTLLHAAAETDDNVKAVIHFFPEHLIYCANSRGETPLHIAARAGKAVAVELLLRQGVPIDPDRCGNSALHEAVRNRHRKVIGQLVREDPSLLYYENNESKSPLCIAIETGDLEVLTLLLEAPNNCEDWRRSKGERIFRMPPVHVAILHKEKDMLIKMWEKKPWLFQLRDAGDGTPLHLAAYKNYLDGVKFLIDKFPASAFEKDIKDHLPIHVACMMDNVKIIEELLQKWSDPAEFLAVLGQNILHLSAKYGSIATVEYILKSPKFDHLINARDFDGSTPLHLAASHCQPSVVLLARDRRVDVKLVNNNNMTARDVVLADLVQEMKERIPLAGKWYTELTLEMAGTPRSKELVICKPTGRSPQKQVALPKGWKGHREIANFRAVVLALVASVTFTSGFSVSGGYNGSEGDAGIPVLLHKAMYNVFVISNSMAMYSSITSLIILLWSSDDDPYVGLQALLLSNLPFLVTLGTMLLAFMAGVYVTVTKFTWLSIFVIVMGSVALFIFLIFFVLIYVVFVFKYKPPLVGRFVDQLLIFILQRFGGDLAESETAGPAPTSIRGTRDASAPT